MGIAGHRVIRRGAAAVCLLPLLCGGAAAFCIFPVVCGAGSGSGTAASFLKLPSNAKAMGAGTGGVVLADGVGDMGVNPAAVAAAGREVHTTYGPYLQGYDLLHVGYGHPFPLGKLGVSMVRLAAGDFEGRDGRGRKGADFGAEDRVISLGLGRRLDSYPVALGATLKHLYSRIESERAQAFALDLGALVFSENARVPYAVGLAARHMGNGMSFLDEPQQLPLTLSFGVSAEVASPLELVAGVERQIYDRVTEFGAGLRISPVRHVSFNGSFSRLLGRDMPLAGRVGGGIEVSLSRFRLDYAFAPMGSLGNSQRVSLTLRFGERGASERLRGSSRERTEGRARTGALNAQLNDGWLPAGDGGRWK